MNAIRRLLGIGNSVDAILADFNKITARLRGAIDFHKTEVAFHTAAMAVSAEMLTASQTEIERANKVVANIEKLIAV